MGFGDWVAMEMMIGLGWGGGNIDICLTWKELVCFMRKPSLMHACSVGEKRGKITFNEKICAKIYKNNIIIIIIQKICSAHISTLLGAQGTNPETPGQAPSLSR